MAAPFLAALLLIVTAPSGRSASYYVDPATGSMANPGTSGSPWSTLEAVFTANKTFVAGDVIYLRTGYHGLPQVKGNNSGNVTIRPDAGANPKLRRLIIRSASRWIITGLDICPEYAGAGTYDTSKNVVEIQNTSSYITINNCSIRQALGIAGWTASNWQTRLGICSAISVGGPNSAITGNQLENVSHGMGVSKTAPFTRVSGNTITAFYNDGIRGLADDCVYENNLIQDSYVSDSNHDDFFQSWSADAAGAVGKGTVYRVTLRGNVFISRRSASQPNYAAPQGIGCFDGMFQDWVVQNNLIVTRHYHGITLAGAINCRVVNNTAVENPLDGTSDVRPNVMISSHKESSPGVPWPVPSSGNLVRNNLTSKAAGMVTGGGTMDHNLATTDYQAFFTNHAGFNFSLKSTAPAVDAGSASSAPNVDIEGNPRVVPYDIGAYEYHLLPKAYEGFSYAATTDVGTAPDSPDDFGFIGNTWTRTNDIISPGLTRSGLTTLGNAIRFSSNIDSSRALDMTAFPSDYTQVDADGVTRLGKPGTTLWFRFLMKIEGTDADGTLTAGLNLLGSPTGSVVKLRMGDVGTGPNWSVIKGATQGSSGTPLVAGNTVLVVARVKFVAGTNNDEVDLFINPPLNATPPATPSATLRNLDIGTFDRLEVKGNRTSVIDEISVGTAWNSL